MNYFRKIQFNIVQKILETNEILVFQKRTSKVLNSVLNDSIAVVFDIGANKGQSIKLFQKWFPKSKIYSFEPNPKLFSQLKNKYLNNKQIKLFEVALSNKNGEKQFNENLFDSSSTLETINPHSKYLQKKSRILGVSQENLITSSYPVRIKKLSDVIKELNLKTVDFIKIEHKILDFWSSNSIFDKRRKLNENNDHWSFIDGPITANNPMGVHHAWGRTLKDLYNRYKSMNE